MEELLGFKITFWDYVTFAVLFACIAIGLTFIVWVAGLPGQIAIARNHPDAEAVKVMGYSGFLAVVPWIQAFIWAFKPTDIIDIRRFPAAEAQEIGKEIARLKAMTAKPVRKHAKPAKEEAPPKDSSSEDPSSGEDNPEN
ncbi:superinfection immunity protein [Haloferula sp.]|uniref:superinfection immunity protein n=1 Tax=Haloferula sp. TaxID=2497595 RepID=UPI003C719EC2